MRDIEQFARPTRLQYIFHGKYSDLHPFHFPRQIVLDTTYPAVSDARKLSRTWRLRSALQIFKRADQKIICHRERERRALKDLTGNKNIVLKKANKGTAPVIMNRQDKIEEGQSLFDDRSNYQPLVERMVESTSQKVQQLVKSLS